MWYVYDCKHKHVFHQADGGLELYFNLHTQEIPYRMVEFVPSLVSPPSCSNHIEYTKYNNTDTYTHPIVYGKGKINFLAFCFANIIQSLKAFY